MAETPTSSPLAVQVMVEITQDPEIQLMISIEHLILHFTGPGANGQPRLDELAVRRVLDHVRAKRVMAG